MDFLDLTLPTLPENLALDEALLLDAEDGGPDLLRVWQWPRHAVVLGAGGKVGDDVHEDACRADGVEIARRSSGGGTVLLGPGCLLYSVVLAYDRDPALAEIPSSYRYILGRLTAALDGLSVAGCSDLVRLDRKVSGNAQHRKRAHLLHHGTLLYDFDAGPVSRYLKQPPRQPDYRRRREHGEFISNLPVEAPVLTRCLRGAWGADVTLPSWPAGRVRTLVAEKYATEAWVRRR